MSESPVAGVIGIWAVVNIPAQTKAAIDYRICRYGSSRMAFRGPVRDLGGDYVAVLGGSETFGKYVPEPFPDLLEADLHMPVVNFGIMQAGTQVLLEDRALLDLAREARICVLQVPGAANMSNRYYSVHPRRNDRFLTGSDSLQALYPRLDFTEFNFTGHLLTALEDRDPNAFSHVVAELKLAWVRRMREILRYLDLPVILLWMSDRTPEETTDTTFDPDPLFVDRAMLRALGLSGDALVEATASQKARREGLRSRVYLPGEEAAARALPGPRFHKEAAAALAKALRHQL